MQFYNAFMWGHRHHCDPACRWPELDRDADREWGSKHDTETNTSQSTWHLLTIVVTRLVSHTSYISSQGLPVNFHALCTLAISWAHMLMTLWGLCSNWINILRQARKKPYNFFRQSSFQESSFHVCYYPGNVLSGKRLSGKVTIGETFVNCCRLQIKDAEMAPKWLIVEALCRQLCL